MHAGPRPVLRQLALHGGVADPSIALKALDESRPPLSSLPDMFEDLVGNANALGAFDAALARFEDEPLRVGTACSGLESPISAMRMINDALRALRRPTLNYKHGQSCESVGWAQDEIIKRNFVDEDEHVLFCDVRELANEKAHTADGRLVPVKRDIDVLIASPACVDFSTLNRNRKGLDDGGQSGQTFYGVFDYAEVAPIAMVILENVERAEWAKIAELFEGIGYVVAYMPLNAQDYYLPQARRRVYMLAVRADLGATEADADRFRTQVKALERPASSPLEAFMLPNTDPRVRKALAEHAEAMKTTPSDWGPSKVRHDELRRKKKLGNGHVYTDLADLTDRATSAADLQAVLYVQKNVDIRFNSAALNVNQNAGWASTARVFGVAPTIPTSGGHFLTSPGRRMIALEALKLEGQPIDKLDLSGVSNARLHRVAGNMQ